MTLPALPAEGSTAWYPWAQGIDGAARGTPTAAGWFGTGEDGDATITTNASLANDVAYRNLTINAGVTLRSQNYRIFVSGTLTLNGTIASDGDPGAQGGWGTAPFDGSVSGGINGAAAGAGVGANALVSNSSNPGLGGNGGNGGAGASGAGGTGTTITTPDALTGGTKAYANIVQAILGRRLWASGLGVVVAGGGGGAGGGDGSTGAGGGKGGGTVIVAARALAGTGTIRAAGGVGGTPSAGNRGGGGGGGGGIVVLVSSAASNPLTIAVSGGAGGSGVGTGTAGQAGAPGRAYLHLGA